jgi:hypothetical protein
MKYPSDKKQGDAGVKERVNLYLPRNIRMEADGILKKSHSSLSELVTYLLWNYIAKVRQEELERELEEGYKANSSYYRRSGEEWKHADSF